MKHAVLRSSQERISCGFGTSLLGRGSPSFSDEHGSQMRGVNREAVGYGGRYRVGGFSVQSPGFQVCRATVSLGIYFIALLLVLQFSHLTGLIPRV